MANLQKFYFIEDFDKDHLKSLDLNTNVIYRNYKEKYSMSKILKIKKYCKKIRKKFFLANDINMSIKLGLDGAYIPAFNKDISIKNLLSKKLLLLGSAHNLKEINEKKKQGVQILFLSPLFKVEKSKKFLDIFKFNIYSRVFNGSVVALGGIRRNNINRVKALNCFGFASISYIKNTIK